MTTRRESARRRSPRVILINSIMLILIAESKTMAPCLDIVSRNDHELSRPQFDSEAGIIMDSLRDIGAGELAGIVRISPAMARRLQQMIYEFPHRNVGTEAIRAFTGVVFRAFGYGTLPAGSLRFVSERIRIISSLYGWLRPDDIIKPYRFDFITPLAPGGASFASYWREAVTGCLIDELKNNGSHDVLSLLPAEAARCIDWKTVERHAQVWKAEFGEIQPGGAVRTPNSSRLKTLRGLLLRQIITENIRTPEELMTTAGNQYIACGTDGHGNIIFQTVSDTV